jgi:hypothetical protein
MIRTKNKNNNVNKILQDAQFGPKKFCKQLQVNEFPLAKQLPPFKHGFEQHGLKLAHNGPL